MMHPEVLHNKLQSLEQVRYPQIHMRHLHTKLRMDICFVTSIVR